MTNEEAIEMLDAAIEIASYKMAVALLVAKQAIEKQIPKKVVWKPLGDGLSLPYCSTCGNIVIYSSYCDKCGKAIDWSDEK